MYVLKIVTVGKIMWPTENVPVLELIIEFSY